MRYGECRKYGFSLMGLIMYKLTPRSGWIELGIPLCKEDW